MKKTLTILALVCMMGAGSLQAQEIFNNVVNRAKLTLEDPQASKFQIAVSQFKYTAMQYLCTTAISQNGGEVSADFLDQQAYSMNHFVNSYFSALAKSQRESNSAQKDIMKKYWKASLDNPMFENQDKTTTEAFIDDPECLTPFSLNTNWEKADEQANKE